MRTPQSRSWRKSLQLKSKKLTGIQVYAIIQKEILANTLLSRPVGA